MGGAINKNLIVGIDPGTTTALCLFDLGGKMVSLESRKNFSKPEITKYIKEFGYPVIIASDINPPPRSIEKIAASFYVKLMFPETKVSRREKIACVERYAKKSWYKEFPWSNRHERDALFASLNAWNRINPLIRRINSKVKSSKVVREFVKRNVILGEGSISESIRDYEKSL